jgi:methane monooxygenase component A alpha chain/propane monooxygenase large subunit
MQDLPQLPPLCQVCQMPCVLPRPDRNAARIFEFEGKRIACCGEGCEWVFRNWPHQYASRKQFWARYHGWDLADVIIDLGYVRPDGKTLVGQPTIDPDQRPWTISDIRKIGYEVKNPLHVS